MKGGHGFAANFLVSGVVILATRTGWIGETVLIAAVLGLSRLYRARFYLDVGPEGLFARRGLDSVHVATSEIVELRREEALGTNLRISILRERELPLELWLAAEDVSSLEVKLDELREGESPDVVVRDSARRLDGHSVGQLRALALAPETFRAAGFVPEILERLVIDPSVSPRARARAAIALGSCERVRVAVAETTIPELRAVFERVESDDVEEALAAIDRIAT